MRSITVHYDSIREYAAVYERQLRNGRLLTFCDGDPCALYENVSVRLSTDHGEVSFEATVVAPRVQAQGRVLAGLSFATNANLLLQLRALCLGDEGALSWASSHNSRRSPRDTDESIARWAGAESRPTNDADPRRSAPMGADDRRDRSMPTPSTPSSGVRVQSDSPWRSQPVSSDGTRKVVDNHKEVIHRFASRQRFGVQAHSGAHVRVSEQVSTTWPDGLPAAEEVRAVRSGDVAPSDRERILQELRDFVESVRFRQPHEVLGVEPQCDRDTLQAAYSRVCMTFGLHQSRNAQQADIELSRLCELVFEATHTAHEKLIVEASAQKADPSARQDACRCEE